MRPSARIILVVATLSMSGCFAPGMNEKYKPDDGPGSDIWGSDDVGCSNDGDCAASESCIAQVCQVKRCGAGPYESVAPIGSNHFFMLDRELAVTDTAVSGGAYYADGYTHAPGAVAYSYSWNIGNKAPLDVAGGNLVGERPEETVIAVAGETSVAIVSADPIQWLDVDFVPVAVAAGDVDADGIDEVIALAANAEVASCSAVTGACEYSNFGQGFTGVDIASGDMDRDGLDEAVVLLSDGTWSFVIAVNVLIGPNEPNSFGGTANDVLSRISAGDLDGDGFEEAIGLTDTIGADTVIVYSLAGTFSEKGRTTVGSGVLDLSASMLQVEQPASVVLLSGGKQVQILSGNGSAPLTTGYTGTLGTTTTPTRIASVDFDGDSPAARLLAGPDPVPGPVVPTMAVQFPPYYRYRSNGTSSLFFGDSTNSSSDVSDTVSMNMGIDVGVQVGFASIFTASVSESLSRAVSMTTTRSQSISAGANYSVSPDPDLYGTQYATIAVSYGCFHGYTYEMDDPANKMGGSGGKFVLFVPVEGKVSLWSTTRYNAMARALGTLPEIPVPYSVGDPHSFPSTFKDLEGGQISTDDLLFPSPGNYAVSDVGQVGFSLSASENVINSQSTSIDVGLSASLGAGGFTVGASLGQGWGKGVSLGIGESVSFSGLVPAVPDDPETPGDEYAEFAYSFSPVIYRQHYVDESGNDATYYSMTFTTEF